MDFLPQLVKDVQNANEADRKEIMHLVFTSLNNSNFEEYDALQYLIKASFTGLCEYKLLSVSDITALMISEAKHFVKHASRWVHEIYIYIYMGYAIEYDYPFVEMTSAINQSSKDDVVNYMLVLQQTELAYFDEEQRDLVERTIQFISIYLNEPND